MQDNEENVNITFTLPKSIASWLERKMAAEDLNRSQVARKVFREAMRADAKTKLVRAPKKRSK